MAVEELVELKFRLSDGCDIGPTKFKSSATVASVKDTILALWPKDKLNVPKSVNEVILINAGKILENKQTVAESRTPLSEIPGEVIIMHVVLRPPIPVKHKGKVQESSKKKGGCLFCFK